MLVDRAILCRLTNQDADSLLAIPDKFGMQRREEYEKKQAALGESTKSSATDLESSHGAGKSNGVPSKSAQPPAFKG